MNPKRLNPSLPGSLALALAASASMAWFDHATAGVTNVSTPSGAAHGSLVTGNIPCAIGANEIGDCGKTAPTGAIAGTSDTQTLTNKSISGAQNTLTGIPDSALSANVDLLNGAQTLTGLKTLNAGADFSAGTVTMPDGSTWASTGLTANTGALFTKGTSIAATGGAAYNWTTLGAPSATNSAQYNHLRVTGSVSTNTYAALYDGITDNGLLSVALAKLQVVRPITHVAIPERQETDPP